MPGKGGFCAPGSPLGGFSAQPDATIISGSAGLGALQSRIPSAINSSPRNVIFPRQLSEPCLHGHRTRSEHLLRDLRVYRMIAGIVGEMEFECAIGIDADIGKAQRKRASGPACMQSHFPPARAVKPPFGSGNPRQIRQQPSRQRQGAGIGRG
jgi:hypothetical protein